MHDAVNHLNMNIALPAERLQHGVDMYILPYHGFDGQSTVNVVIYAYVMSAVYYLRNVKPTVYCEQ